LRHMVTPMQQANSHPGEGQNMEPLPRLDWFTTNIFPDGTQTVRIRPATATNPNQTIELNHPDSQLLMKTLAEIARVQGIPWSEASQAVLRAFWKTLSAR
jgi:hypothetical protein